MKIIDIISGVAKDLVDATSVTWTKVDLLSYYNAAIRFVVSARPDSYVSTEDFTCADGSFQELPSNALRLMDLVNNKISGRPISVIDRDTLDRNFLDWYNPITRASEVDHFVFDDRSPREFYVYPAVAADTVIRAIFSKIPDDAVITDFVGDTQLLPVNLAYLESIKMYMMYRAYIKEVTGQDIAKATNYLSSAGQLLEMKTDSDTSTSPNRKKG